MKNLKQTNNNFSDSANNNIIKVNLKKNDAVISNADLYEARKIFADVYDTEIEATIAVVAYNRPDVTELCIESILKYTKDVNYKLLLIYNENENGKGILEYFKNADYKNKAIIHISENLGAPLAYQEALKHFEGKYFVHLPNDVIVTPRWLSNLIKCAESDKKIGMVNPVSSNASNLQCVDFDFDSYDKLQECADKFNVSDSSKWSERIRLITLGTLFTRECLSAIGNIFDTGFFHNFGDDDVSFRARRAGYKLILAEDTWVHHNHTFSNNANNSLETGRKNFKEKYLGIDAWDDTTNFVFTILEKYLNKPDSDNVKILGIDTKCGTPVLDIKNMIRKYGVCEPKVSAFTSDAKYYTDLKTICSNDVVCGEAYKIPMSFSGNFNYIIIDKSLNTYPDYQKLLCQIYNMLSSGGQLFFNMQNTDNIFRFLKMCGKCSYSATEEAADFDIGSFYSDCKSKYNIQLISVLPVEASDDTIAFVRSILEAVNNGNTEKATELSNMLIADKYWFSITK